MNRNPLVSVCMLAFNHAEYIGQAIEGILLQKTAFSIELVIGEDHSTDGTKELCLRYQGENPDLIRILERGENRGMQRNFMETLKACSGKYVAICEADDYWTDPTKLQKQVDFMESHPDFAITHHQLKIVQADDIFSGRFTPTAQPVTTFEDLARHQHIATASCMFRNKLFEFPDAFLDVHGTDYFLNLLNSYHGKIGFMDEVMGAYRVHDSGEWGGKNLLERAEIALNTIKICGSYFHPRAEREFGYQTLKNECLLRFEQHNFDEFRTLFARLRVESKELLTPSDRIALWTRYFLSRFPLSIGGFDRLRKLVRRHF